MNLGERIYQLRTEKEMSQGDLAEALEVSRQSISKWETNGSVPELEKIVKLSEVFGVSLDALVTGKEYAERPAAQEVEPQVVYIEKPVKKRSTAAQKWCFVLCSLVCVLLLTNLAAIFLLPDGEPEDQPSTGPAQQAPQNFEVSASDVQCVEIVWNGGDVHILAIETDEITVAGSSCEAERIGNLLKIQADDPSDKDLIITVPKNWSCRELKLQGASITADLADVSIVALELIGSDCKLSISGSPEQVKINGNRCTLELTLPEACGFSAELDRIHSSFHSDLFGIRYEGDRYTFGDQRCKIQVDGISCEVFISQSN